MLKGKKQITGVLVTCLVLAAAAFGQSNDSEPESIGLGVGKQGGTIVIDRSGDYRLVRDINVRSGDGIRITADNVNLDLAGNTLSTSAAGTGRGIAVVGSGAVKISNGKVAGFNTNVFVSESVNVNAGGLQIAGTGLAPKNGPSEIGIQIINSRNVYIFQNNISNVNLGVFVRGGSSAGNRIFENLIVGGADPANNLLGICYNPAPEGGDSGPRGDNIYNNHIARFNFAISVSANSLYNIFNENTASSFSGLFRDPAVLEDNGGTNISEGNLSTVIPAEVLP